MWTTCRAHMRSGTSSSRAADVCAARSANTVAFPTIPRGWRGGLPSSSYRHSTSWHDTAACSWGCCRTLRTTVGVLPLAGPRAIGPRNHRVPWPWSPTARAQPPRRCRSQLFLAAVAGAVCAGRNGATTGASPSSNCRIRLSSAKAVVSEEKAVTNYKLNETSEKISLTN